MFEVIFMMEMLGSDLGAVCDALPIGFWVF
jgi:hypothetical protein